MTILYSIKVSNKLWLICHNYLSQFIWEILVFNSVRITTAWSHVYLVDQIIAYLIKISDKKWTLGLNELEIFLYPLFSVFDFLAPLHLVAPLLLPLKSHQSYLSCKSTLSPSLPRSSSCHYLFNTFSFLYHILIQYFQLSISLLLFIFQNFIEFKYHYLFNFSFLFIFVAVVVILSIYWSL